jgi:small-conductance mechanosensitive channel
MIPIQETLFPAFLCGIVAGILSAVPIIELSECFFCFWAVGAGALAVFVLKRTKKIEEKIRTFKAATTGAMADFIATIAMWLTSLAVAGSFSSALWNVITGPGYQQAFRQTGTTSEFAFLVAFVIMIVITGILLAVFGVIGGIIANEITKGQDKT